jgi:hypothetical protein
MAEMITPARPQPAGAAGDVLSAAYPDHPPRSPISRKAILEIRPPCISGFFFRPAVEFAPGRWLDWAGNEHHRDPDAHPLSALAARTMVARRLDHARTRLPDRSSAGAVSDELIGALAELASWIGAAGAGPAHPPLLTRHRQFAAYVERGLRFALAGLAGDCRFIEGDPELQLLVEYYGPAADDGGRP